MIAPSRALRTSLDPMPSVEDLKRMYRERTGRDFVEDASLLAERARHAHIDRQRSKPTLDSTDAPYAFRSGAEVEFARRLEVLRRAKLIRAWQYEARRFVVGVRRTYRPDFRIVHCDRRIEYVEVKGSVRAKNARDSITRLHAAARQYPHLTFTLATRTGGEWRHQTISEAA